MPSNKNTGEQHTEPKGGEAKRNECDCLRRPDSEGMPVGLKSTSPTTRQPVDCAARIERFSNGRCADLKLFQRVADEICQAIMAKNPEFRGKGLTDASNAVIDLLDDYFAGSDDYKTAFEVQKAASDGFKKMYEDLLTKYRSLEEECYGLHEGIEQLKSTPEREDVQPDDCESNDDTKFQRALEAWRYWTDIQEYDQEFALRKAIQVYQDKATERESSWQSIETAPKDGTEVLLYYVDWCNDGRIIISGAWDEPLGIWRHEFGHGDAQAWMPLLQPSDNWRRG